jgi:A/G-specific adenine glycosylase
MGMNDDEREHFREAVWNYYHTHGRHDLPWRQPGPDGQYDAYHITVSEVMLQQTQVSRVIPKYHEFMEQFPTVQDLAAASLGDVLRIWNGLGYNRRAKFLWQAAQAVERAHGGQFPDDLAALVALPGIGLNTAGAILAYAYGQPAVFVETNIRTVFIHHFFHDEAAGVTEAAIQELVAATLDQEHPREWYWALMDYGAYLKQTVGNLNRQSRAYAKQTLFHGSRRQIRGQVLRLLGNGPQTVAALRRQIPDERLSEVLQALVDEQLIHRRGEAYYL